MTSTLSLSDGSVGLSVFAALQSGLVHSLAAIWLSAGKIGVTALWSDLVCNWMVFLGPVGG